MFVRSFVVGWCDASALSCDDADDIGVDVREAIENLDDGGLVGHTLTIVGPPWRGERLRTVGHERGKFTQIKWRHCLGFGNAPAKTFPCCVGWRLIAKSDRPSLEKRMFEHVGTVVVEVGVLLAREVTDANAGIYAPRVEKLVSDLGDDHEFLAP